MIREEDFKLVWNNNITNYKIYSIDSPLVEGRWVIMKRKFYEL